MPIEQLPPGATKLRLVGLTPNTQYIAAVAHVEPAPSNGFTTPQQVTFTTSSGVGTCAAPDDIVPFVTLYPNPRSAGIAIFNTEPVPGTLLAFQMALETGVGTNVYGSWVEIDRRPVAPFTWFVEKLSLPPDGVRRAFQVKAVRPGTTDSAFSARVAIDPSVALAPADYPVAPPPDMNIQPVAIVMPSGMTVALTATYTVPSDHQFGHMEYFVEPQTAPGVFGPGHIHAGGSTGSDVILAQAAGTYRVTPYTVTTGSPTLTTGGPGMVITPTRTAGSSYVVTALPLSNAPTIVATVDANNVTYAITADVGTGFIRVYSEVFATDPVIETVENFANWVTDLDPTKTSLQLPVTSGDPVRYATFVPYDKATGRGLALTIVSTRNAGASTPSAPTLAAATFAGTGGTGGGTGPSGGSWLFPGWVGMKVTFVTAPTAGDLVRLNRGGVIVAIYTITAADVTAGHCTVFDNSAVYPNTYSYTAQQTKAGAGTSPASPAAVVTMLAGYKLSAIASLTLSQSTSGAPLVVSITLPSDNELPPGASVTITYIQGLSSGSYGGATTVPPMVLLTSAGATSGSWQIAPVNGFTYVRVQLTAPGYTASSVVGAFINSFLRYPGLG